MNKDKFFKQLPYAITYADVLLIPGASEYSPSEVSLEGMFSKNIKLSLPVVSAAMDTVTESDMAIAMAENGGIGIIHSGLSIEQQSYEVRRVKLHHNGRIDKPVTFFSDQTIGEVLSICQEKRYSFRTFPITDRNGKFSGLLTQNDFDFCKDPKTLVSAAMTPAKDVVCAEGAMEIKKAAKQMEKNKKKTLPLISSNGEVKGMYIYSDLSRIMNGAQKFNLDDSGGLRVGAAVPTDKTALERVQEMANYIDVVVIDSAQGDTKYAFETLKDIKRQFPGLDVVVGNITSPDSAKKLVQLGADGIKVGQGPGSICTTRQQTGIGYPQVSAIYNCAQAIKGSGVPIIADGGIKFFGDVSKALAAGASCVMLGSMLAGTYETPGEAVVLADGSRAKVFRGMGSSSALSESSSARSRYKASGVSPLAEGVEAYIPENGSVVGVLEQLNQGLRRSFVYVGVQNIIEHQAKTDFVLLSPQSQEESGPHITNKSLRIV